MHRIKDNDLRKKKKKDLLVNVRYEYNLQKEAYFLRLQGGFSRSNKNFHRSMVSLQLSVHRTLPYLTYLCFIF